VLIVVSHILSIGHAPATNSWLEKTSKVHFILQILIKVVSAFHSCVFSCLLAWVVTIIRGCLGDTSGCKSTLLRTIFELFFQEFCYETHELIQKKWKSAKKFLF